MSDGRYQSWWIIVPKCLPLAIPVDLAAKAHDDGRYPILLGSYVQAYDACSQPKGPDGWPDVGNTTPAEAVWNLSAPPRRPKPSTPVRERLGERLVTEFSGFRNAIKGPPARPKLAGPPTRPRPAIPAGQCLPSPEQIGRMRQMLAKDGPTRPDVLEAVRQDLSKTIERYEQARTRGEDVSMTQRRIVAARAMIAAMEENL